MNYAKDTTVSVEKSKAEIEATVMRYGATGFVSGWALGFAQITFEMRDRRIRFMLPLPDKADKAFTHKKDRWGYMKAQTPEQTYKAWEQACRQRWRALLLAIKAKLEAVECKISSFDDEFLANIVMPNGFTIGETMRPQLPEMVATGKLPLLLAGPMQ